MSHVGRNRGRGRETEERNRGGTGGGGNRRGLSHSALHPTTWSPLFPLGGTGGGRGAGFIPDPGVDGCRAGGDSVLSCSSYSRMSRVTTCVRKRTQLQEMRNIHVRSSPVSLQAPTDTHTHTHTHTLGRARRKLRQR